MSQTGISPASGFTLLEALIVVAIVGLLAAAIPAATGRVSDAARLRSAADLLADDLRTLQRTAIDTDLSASLTIGNDRDAYTLMPGSILRSLPHGATITFTPNAQQLARLNEGMIAFHNGGVVTGGRFNLTLRDATRAVTVSWPAGSVTSGL